MDPEVDPVGFGYPDTDDVPTAERRRIWLLEWLLRAGLAGESAADAIASMRLLEEALVEPPAESRKKH